MPRDLTTGKPFRLILSFAIPFLMVNLFQQIYNIADMLIVGRILGTEAMTAVGSTGNLMWLTISASTSLGLGFSMLTAQYFGAKNQEGVKKSYSVAVLLCVVFNVILSVLGIMFLREILIIFKFPEEIINDTYSYFKWILAGVIPNAVFSLNSNMMRALGEAKTPMAISVISCVINVVLDYVMIAFFKMGTAGAGVATFISQTISCIISIIFVIRHFPQLHFRIGDMMPDRHIVKSLMKLGLPVAFFDVMNSSSAVIGQFAVNSMGVDYITAVTAGSKIASFLNTALFAVGSAVTVFAAQNYGAGRFDRIKRGVRDSIVIMTSWNIFMVVFCIFAGKPLIGFVANTENMFIIENAYNYLNINVVLYIFVVLILAFRSTIQACGNSTAPVISAFGELFGRLFAAFYLAKVFGFMGVILINPTACIIATVINGIGYLSFVKKINKSSADAK